MWSHCRLSILHASTGDYSLSAVIVHTHMSQKGIVNKLDVRNTFLFWITICKWTLIPWHHLMFIEMLLHLHSNTECSNLNTFRTHSRSNFRPQSMWYQSTGNRGDLKLTVVSGKSERQASFWNITVLSVNTTVIAGNGSHFYLTSVLTQLTLISYLFLSSLAQQVHYRTVDDRMYFLLFWQGTSLMFFPFSALHVWTN